MSTGMSTIWRHEQFLKNYNMIQQIGHRYDTILNVSRSKYRASIACGGESSIQII